MKEEFVLFALMIEILYGDYFSVYMDCTYLGFFMILFFHSSNKDISN